MIRYLLIFFLLGFWGISQAQHYSFIQFGTNSGLPQSQVKSIVQDTEGYLWIGTYGGLARFDGINFERFGKNNGLLNNRVTHLQFLDNVLYIGHNQGISILGKDRSFTPYSFQDEQVSAEVTSLMKIKSELFVATNGDGLFKLDTNKRQLVRVPNSPERIRAGTFFKEDYYLATRIGLYIFDGKKFTLLPQSKDISLSGLSSKDGVLYMTSFYGEVYSISNKNDSLHLILEDEAYILKGIIIDGNNHKWLHSPNGVLYIKDHETLSLSERSGLPTDDINVIFEDQENNIWMGTNGKGLIRFTDEVFTYYNTKSGFPSDIVIAFEIDDQGNKWISTIDQGVFRIDSSGKIEHIDYLVNDVWQIRSDKEGVLFASELGLHLYDYTKFYSFYAEETLLPSNRITGILKLNTRNYLISTSEGGAYFDISSQSFFTAQNSFSSIKRVRDGLMLNGNTYLISSNLLYIIKGENTEIKQFDSNINSIEKDKTNTLWIGTENGLFYMKNDEFVAFPLDDNEGFEFINFLKTYDTLLFIGTNGGLYEVGNSKKFRYRYGINSGLIDLETNLNSSFVEDNHFMWFGTASGLIRMDLKERHRLFKRFIPKLILTDIIVNNKSIPREKIRKIKGDSNTILEIKYSEKNLTFLFNGIYTTNPEALMYSYFLENFSSEWTTPSRNPTVSFVNLPAKKYVLNFKVQAGIDGKSKIFRVTFRVHPPFYQTWWFYTLFALLTILLIVFLERNRTKRMKLKNYRLKLEYQNKLTKLEQQSLNANMNRHFIFNSLNSIQYYINTNDTKLANKYLSRFAKLIRKNLDSSNSEDGMVTLEDELDRLRLYLELETMRFAGKFDYEISVSDEVDVELLKVPSMLLQPFVENSIIHGVLPLKDRKGRILIEVTDHLDHIRIRIQDNGIGIDNSRKLKEGKKTEHISQGMLISKKRIELLKRFSEQSIDMIGPLQINENDSLISGTVITFKILKQFLV